MEAIAQSFHTVEPAHPALTNIKITFYELIAAICDEVQPGEDWLVTETVRHLLDTGRVRFLSAASNVKKLMA